MILTTTPSVEGHTITVRDLMYGLLLKSGNDAGVALAEAVAGSVDAFADMMNARAEALSELEQRAASLGADAVVGIDVDYEVLGANNGMLMVTASGTAVSLD